MFVSHVHKHSSVAQYGMSNGKYLAITPLVSTCGGEGVSKRNIDCSINHWPRQVARVGGVVFRACVHCKTLGTTTVACTTYATCAALVLLRAFSTVDCSL